MANNNGFFSGFSQSLNNVGQGMPQTLENQRISTQQAALDLMRQKQQEAQHKEQLMLQRQNQERQQENTNREFQERKRQFDLNYGLNENKLNFEQGKFQQQNPDLFSTPEQKQQLGYEKNLEKIQKLLKTTNIQNKELLNEELGTKFKIEEIAPKANKLFSDLENKIATHKGSSSVSRAYNNITNNFSNEILALDNKGSYIKPDNINNVLKSGAFDNLLEKNGFKNDKEKNQIKSDLKSYGKEINEKALIIADNLINEYKIKGFEANVEDTKNAVRNALLSSNPEEGLLNLYEKVFSTGENPINSEEFKNLVKTTKQQEQNQGFRNNSQESTERQFNDDLQKELLAFSEKIPEEIQQNEEKNLLKQRNEILNKNVDQEIKNEIDKNISFTSNMLGVSLTPEQMKQSSQQFSVIAEPIRKITHGIANLFDLDPEILHQPESVKAFESDKPISNFLLQLPAQLFLYAGGEKALGTIANLAKKGISEKFIAKTAISALSTGEIDKLSGGDFAEGAAFGAGGVIGGEILGKGIQGLNNKFNKKIGTNLENKGEKFLSENVPAFNKELESKSNKILEEKIKPIIENNIDLKKDLNPEIVKGFQDKGKEYLEKAQENYKKSKDLERNFTINEKEEFLDNISNISDKLKRNNKGDVGIARDINKVENMLLNIDSSEDAINTIKNLNRDYTKSENGFYQEIAKSYKPIIEDLISKVDNGYYKEGNRYYKNLKEFEKKLKTDSIVTDSFKFADDISELGNKDLVALNNLNDLHAKDFNKLLKNKNLQKFDLTTKEGLKSTIDQSLQDIHKTLNAAENKKGLNTLITNFDKELVELKYRLKEHPDLETKYQNINSELKKYNNSINEIEGLKQLNEKTLKEFSSKASEDFIKNPEKIIDEIGNVSGKETLEFAKQLLPKAWSLLSEIGTLGFIPEFFAKREVNKKLKDIVKHNIKNEKFASKLIAEDLAKDLKNEIKKYKEVAEKSKNQSKDRLINVLGKITIQNLKRDKND